MSTGTTATLAHKSDEDLYEFLKCTEDIAECDLSDNENQDFFKKPTQKIVRSNTSKVRKCTRTKKANINLLNKDIRNIRF